jgi:hypothetical protein
MPANSWSREVTTTDRTGRAVTRRMPDFLWLILKLTGGIVKLELTRKLLAGGTTSTVEEKRARSRRCCVRCAGSKATTVEFPAYKKGVATWQPPFLCTAFWLRRSDDPLIRCFSALGAVSVVKLACP